MIVLTRREGESIHIGDAITVTTISVRPGVVLLDVTGPALSLPMSNTTNLTPSLETAFRAPNGSNRSTIRCIQGDRIHLSGDISVEVVSLHPTASAYPVHRDSNPEDQQTQGRVKLGIVAPPDVSIYRSEISNNVIVAEGHSSQYVQDGSRDEEISGTQIPTEECVVRLPMLAQVAYAARCVRRLIPLIDFFQGPTPSGLARVAANAVALAQTAAARRDVESEQLEAASRVPDGAEMAINDSRIAPLLIARAAALVARAAARALEHLPSLALAKVSGVVSAPVIEATQTAHSAVAMLSHPAFADNGRARVIAAARSAIVAAMRWDYDLLVHAQHEERWLTSTGVEPEFFGPLWPDGLPPNWPEEEPTSENAELVVTIDAPEGMTDEQVLKMVSDLAVKADAVHRAYGGHGLEVEEGNIEIDRQVLQPVPSGGLS